MFWSLALLACVQPISLPDLGECADYPAPPYDFGQIGIGSCLSGPVSLDWVTQEDGSWRLLVSNANPFWDFDGGSVSSLDLSFLAETDWEPGQRLLTHEITRSSLSMPSFPGYSALVPERDLMLVTNRFSEDARTRVGEDDLYFVDISDPDALDFAPVAEDGAHQLQLGSDPDPLSYDPASGYAFVANLTDHSVSVVDVLSEPVSVLDARPPASVVNEGFTDADASLSRAQITDLNLLEWSFLQDERWELQYAEGSYRLWWASEEGVRRIESTGGPEWWSSGLEFDMDAPRDTDGILGVAEDPQPWMESPLGPRMLFRDAATGDIRSAYQGDFLGSWAYEEAALLEARPGEWDASLGGPMAVWDGNLSWLYYHGQDEAGQWGIGLALSEDGLSFQRSGEGPLIAAADRAHDQEGARDPYLLWDGFEWRLYYSAWDGQRWTVGMAQSPDLEDWTVLETPVFESEDDTSMASPVVSFTGERYRMWTLRELADGSWALNEASSPDGIRWEDRGVVSGLEGRVSQPFPALGLQARSDRSWSLWGERDGSSGYVVAAGEEAELDTLGFSLRLSSGARLRPEDAPPIAALGISPSSWIEEEERLYLTVIGDDGQARIGLATTEGGHWRVQGAPQLEGSDSRFDAGGVSSPVVFPVAGGWRMLYAGSSDGQTRLGTAFSDSGLRWSTEGAPAMQSSSAWNSVSVEPGSVVALEDGRWLMWYTGSDGERTRIGLAESTNSGRSWTTVPGADDDWVLGTGAPGDFDDSSVRDPQVLLDPDGETLHLWYSGFDGERWSLGYASRPLEGGSWVRLGEDQEIVPPALTALGSSFDSESLLRPLVSLQDDGSVAAWYTGDDGALLRAGQAVAPEPGRLFRSPMFPTSGDYLSLSTWQGDDEEEEEDAISLEATIGGFTVPGLGVSQTLLDPERGYLYVASKLSSYFYAIDVRDDSTEDFLDANYLDIEALLVADTTSGAAGFRGMHLPAGSPYLYLVNDAPESVMIFDVDSIEDDDQPQVLKESLVGYLPSSRGIERDEGASTYADIGPIQVTSLGDLLFVANFNANSVGVYDLRLGVYGQLIAEIEMEENPHALSISPDGQWLAVANYLGTVDDNRADSSIALIDLRPESENYLEVVAWIANQ